jgi:hypothetical protein
VSYRDPNDDSPSPLAVAGLLTALTVLGGLFLWLLRYAGGKP